VHAQPGSGYRSDLYIGAQKYGSPYPRQVTDEQASEFLIDRLLLALAAQLDLSKDPVLTAGAAEALADLSRDQAEVLFGQAGHLVHYGADTEPLEALIHAMSAVLSDEAPPDAPFRPGDEVRLVGALPDSLAGSQEEEIREIKFVVRYVGRSPMVTIQTELTEDYWITTVPAADLEPFQS
jgi:hypothetical protein